MEKVVVFDLGGVLVCDVPSKMLKRLAKSLNASPQQFSHFVTAHTLHKDAWDRFKIDPSYSEEKYWEDFLLSANLEELLKEPGIPHLKKLLRESIKCFLPILEVASKLKEKGILIGILSNHCHPWVTAIADQFKLYDIFCKDMVIISCDVACAKPSKEIFMILLERIKNKLSSNHETNDGINLPGSKEEAPSTHVIYFDDKEPNVRAARECGIDGIVFDSKRQSQQDMIKFLAQKGVLL